MSKLAELYREDRKYKLEVEVATPVGRITFGGDWSVAPKPKRTGVESQPATRDGHERTFLTVRGFSIFFSVVLFVFRSVPEQRVSCNIGKHASDTDVSLSPSYSSLSRVFLSVCTLVLSSVFSARGLLLVGATLARTVSTRLHFDKNC